MRLDEPPEHPTSLINPARTSVLWSGLRNGPGRNRSCDPGIKTGGTPLGRFWNHRADRCVESIPVGRDRVLWRALVDPPSTLSVVPRDNETTQGSSFQGSEEDYVRQSRQFSIGHALLRQR